MYFEEPCKEKVMVKIVFSFVPAGCFCTLCHQIMRNHLKLKSHPKENLIPQSRVAAALLLQVAYMCSIKSQKNNAFLQMISDTCARQESTEQCFSSISVLRLKFKLWMDLISCRWKKSYWVKKDKSTIALNSGSWYIQLINDVIQSVGPMLHINSFGTSYSLVLTTTCVHTRGR